MFIPINLKGIYKLEQLYYIATKYYFAFESSKGLNSKMKWNWFFTISLAVIFLGMFCLIYYLLATGSSSTQKLSSSAGLIISEVAFLLSFTSLQEKKKKLILEKNGEKGDGKRALFRAKRKWLLKEVGIKNTEFFETAEQYEKMLKYYFERKTPYENYWQTFFSNLFSDSSKARILSLFIFLISICFLLVMKGVSDSKLFFELLEPNNLISGFFLILLFSFGLHVFIETVKALIRLIGLINSIISIRFENKRSESDEVLRVFIKDLFLLSRLDNRIKVAN